MKKNIIIIVCILVVVLGSVFILNQSRKADSSTATTDGETLFDTSDVIYDLGDGVGITKVSSYTGDYVEDGSDEYLEDIMMLTIENNGENSYQLMNITINNQYHFQVTTLLPGMTMMVLESDRAAYNSTMDLEAVETSNVAVFSEEISLCEDLFNIEASDGTLTITNKSKKDSPEGKVFYKNKISDGYLGGITYCVSFPSMKSGESVTIETSHYSEDSSELLFVTHGE